jgi:hypothetical protein
MPIKICELKKEDLEWATLTDIMHELHNRGYRYIWTAENIFDTGTNADTVRCHLGTDNLVSALRLLAETADTMLEICKKCGADDPFSKTLEVIIKQVEILVGDTNENTDTEEQIY